jgi:hypothetical protein
MPLENQSTQRQTGPSATSHITRGAVYRQLGLFDLPIHHHIQPVSLPTSHPCLQPSSVTIGCLWRISPPNVKPARQLLATSHEGWSVASCVSLICPSAIASSQSPVPPPTHVYSHCHCPSDAFGESACPTSNWPYTCLSHALRCSGNYQEFRVMLNEPPLVLRDDVT